MNNIYKVNMIDYNKELARTCRSGISFDPEKYGARQEIQESNYLNDCKDELFKLIKSDSEIEFYTKTMDYFIDKYIKKLNETNSAQSRCLSSMITGPANFKVTTKANNSYDNRVSELLEIFNTTKAFLNKQLKKLRTQEAGGELAQKKAELETLEKRQELYKQINKICGTIKTTRQEKIEACELLEVSEAVIEEIKTQLRESESGKIKVFAGYQLTNNNAKIKARKLYIARQEKISNRIEEAGAISKIADYKGGEIMQDLEAQRINILFDGKPEQEIINLVKSHGFRWSPKFMQWTRKLTPNALYSVKRMIQAV